MCLQIKFKPPKAIKFKLIILTQYHFVESGTGYLLCCKFFWLLLSLACLNYHVLCDTSIFFII